MFGNNQSEDGIIYTDQLAAFNVTLNNMFRFRTGAFAAGQPVQPISIRHGGGWPGAVDTVTWTWVMEYRVTTLALLTLMTPLTFVGKYSQDGGPCQVR